MKSAKVYHIITDSAGQAYILLKPYETGYWNAFMPMAIRSGRLDLPDLGIGLIYAVWRVWRVPGNKVAFLMYRCSSLYLLFIFIALMLDVLSRHG